jgi:FtsH-binding integral membrane protein
MSSFLKLVNQKKGFLISVYATLIAQLALTFFIVYSMRKYTVPRPGLRDLILYTILSFGLIIMLTFFDLPIWMKAVLFTMYSAVNGYFLYLASAYLPKEVINQALTGAISIFISMSTIAIALAAMGVDLSWMGMILLAAIVGLLIATLVMMLIKNKNRMAHKVLLVVGLIIFCIYVTYATNIMLQKNYQFDFISAAVDLYLGFINMFIRLLTLNSQ